MNRSIAIAEIQRMGIPPCVPGEVHGQGRPACRIAAKHKPKLPVHIPQQRIHRGEQSHQWATDAAVCATISSPSMASPTIWLPCARKMIRRPLTVPVQESPPTSSATQGSLPPPSPWCWMAQLGVLKAWSNLSASTTSACSAWWVLHH
mmetsp:Transcript_119201/g.207475  ORF Transcript_119201/g.207475 Transcript_119201/m.207475 type:complete len:148 (-) Transcript_119201:73-516(-)